VRALFETIRPDTVIHTAALTDVDECERNPEKAKAINSGGTAITAMAAEEVGAHYVYISTDYVFDGLLGGFDETCAPGPVNQYGASKFLGEQMASQNNSRLLTIRTTIFGLKLAPLTGMMESMVAALRDGKPMTRFVDQYFTPLYTGDLSDLILLLAEKQATGVYHVGTADKVSRYEFTKQVAQVFGLEHAIIGQGPFHQIDGLARRPQDTSLKSRRFVERFGIKLPSVREGLRRLRNDWPESSREGMVA
jgi:dTDP-4-dehydrorhamnose reductase